MRERGGEREGVREKKREASMGESPHGGIPHGGGSLMGESPMRESSMERSPMGESSMRGPPMGESPMGDSTMGESPMRESGPCLFKKELLPVLCCCLCLSQSRKDTKKSGERANLGGLPVLHNYLPRPEENRQDHCKTTSLFCITTSLTRKKIDRTTVKLPLFFA